MCRIFDSAAAVGGMSDGAWGYEIPASYKLEFKHAVCVTTSHLSMQREFLSLESCRVILPTFNLPSLWLRQKRKGQNCAGDICSLIQF